MSTPAAPAPGRPLLVALVGPVGGGKSKVREGLVARGAAGLNFDDYSRALLLPGSPVNDRVRAAFPECYDSAGRLDRAALAARIFADPADRARLNALVHPAMLAALRQDLDAFRSGPGAPLLVVEGALLAALPTGGWCDRTVLVTAPREERLRRLQLRDGLSAAAAEQRVRVHEALGLEGLPADEVLDTGCTEADLDLRVAALWGRLSHLAAPGN